MKHLLKSLLIVVLLLPLLASCSKGKSGGGASDGGKDEGSSVDNTVRYMPVKLSGSEYWSILDINDGSIVAEDEFENEPSPILNDRFFVKNENGEYDLYDVNNIKKSIGTYKSATPFRDGRSVVTTDGKTLQLINTDGKEIKRLPSSYSSVSPFLNGFAVVTNHAGKHGFINTQGEVVVDAVYDDLAPFSEDHYALVGKKTDEKEWGYDISIIDDKGKKLFGFDLGEHGRYSAIASSFFVNGSIAVVYNDDVVYLNKNGEKMMKVGDNKNGDYGFYNGMTIYASDDKFGIKNEKGEILLKAKYQGLSPIKNGKFLALKDDKCMIIDKDGNQVSSDKYYALINITENRFLVKGTGYDDWILVDEKGKKIGDKSFSDCVHKDDFSFLSSYFCSIDDIPDASGIMESADTTAYESYNDVPADSVNIDYYDAPYVDEAEKIEEYPYEAVEKEAAKEAEYEYK